MRSALLKRCGALMSTHILGSWASGPTMKMGLWCGGARELVGRRKVVAKARLALWLVQRSPPKSVVACHSTDMFICDACGALPPLLGLRAPAPEPHAGREVEPS